MLEDDEDPVGPATEVEPSSRDAPVEAGPVDEEEPVGSETGVGGSEKQAAVNRKAGMKVSKPSRENISDVVMAGSTCIPSRVCRKIGEAAGAC